MVILLDISDSMTVSELRWSLALEAARQLVAQANPETSFALVLFGTKIAHRVEFSRGREAVRGALESLGPQSAAAKGYERTALVDSVLESLELFDTLQFGDAVFVITDADEGSSRGKPRDLEQELLSRGVRLFGFILPYPPRGTMWPPNAGGGPGLAPGGYELGHDPAGALGRVAQATGGSWYAVITGERYRGEPLGYWLSDARKAAALAAVRNLGRQMEEGYRVEVDLPWAVKEPRPWTLEVVNAAGKKRKDVQVVYPKKLAACGGGKP
ncbi:MAG: VWA domain-containing protein [Acidobacteria bacterium]|nr:VWA domain-containing protein [Acidobacteriota bacterium]